MALIEWRKLLTTSFLDITVGARGSLLSKAQVEEVYQEIHRFFPEIKFHPIWITTKGDQDKTTSLKTLERTNFFTDEIDRRQAAGEFRISVHSAKDLPQPLHPDLEVVALTKGVDPSDSLVVKELPLRAGARIGTSSERREVFLKNWRNDLEFVDVRGTIDERLRFLDRGVMDGVVIAEAALIRLKLTDRPRIHLPCEPAAMQGRLAIVARKNDAEMKRVFQALHYNKVLYVGTDPSRYSEDVVHLPLIETRPLPLPQQIRDDFAAFTHIILTSPNAARILMDQFPLENKQILAIGTGTEEVIKTKGFSCIAVASPQTQEGVIDLLEKMVLKDAYIFYPRSSSARPLLAAYLKEAKIRHCICDLYETIYLKPDPLPSIENFQEIVFTSPSTLKAFQSLYGVIPQGTKLTCIGPITELALREV